MLREAQDPHCPWIPMRGSCDTLFCESVWPACDLRYVNSNSEIFDTDRAFMGSFAVMVQRLGTERIWLLVLLVRAAGGCRWSVVLVPERRRAAFVQRSSMVIRLHVSPQFGPDGYCGLHRSCICGPVASVVSEISALSCASVRGERFCPGY